MTGLVLERVRKRLTKPARSPGKRRWTGLSAPKQILLIRHAEKSFAKADPHLNPRGLERAAALPKLFPGQFDTLGFIFAAAPSRHSNRPIVTVTPLSRALQAA
ncbi:MAG TPA: hypothetical protein VML19_31815 [Verrucomicrobiae bacterium]|nr:hypothetical protein [Verrucomicrobiae bacterium]